MPDFDSKTSKFLQAINKYAEEQRNKLNEDAEKIKEKEQKKIQKQILLDAFNLIQKEMSEMKIKVSRERSKCENEIRKKVFQRRQEITEKIFSQSEKKLIDFSNSKEYEKFLERSVNKISKTLRVSNIIFYISEKDKKYEQKLKNFFEKPCEVHIVNNIKIGGIRGLDVKKGILIDETLDAKLSDQHEWFIENSGLVIS